MEIKYEDMQKIVSAFSSAYDAMNAADFEFEDDEEQDSFYEELARVGEVLDFAESLI